MGQLTLKMLASHTMIAFRHKNKKNISQNIFKMIINNIKILNLQVAFFLVQIPMLLFQNLGEF